VAKFLYSAAMSVDGFIAGRNGDMSWLAEYVGPNPTTDELIPHVGALLVGRRTFIGDDPLKGSRAGARCSAAAGTVRSSC
jgi:riboflavin biosynthesis pyrimidine reductase